MSRSSMLLWKSARRNMVDMPDCPPYLSEPAYANLMFDVHCHVRFCFQLSRDVSEQEYILKSNGSSVCDTGRVAKALSTSLHTVVISRLASVLMRCASRIITPQRDMDTPISRVVRGELFPCLSVCVHHVECAKSTPGTRPTISPMRKRHKRLSRV